MEKYELTPEEELLFEETVGAEVDALGEAILANDELVHIINPESLRRVNIVYGLMKEIYKDCDVEVSYTLHKPFKSSGEVRIKGKRITIPDLKKFLIAVKIMPNVDVYTQANGVINLTFCVNDLTIPVE